jgi:hypothetical protein
MIATIFDPLENLKEFLTQYVELFQYVELNQCIENTQWMLDNSIIKEHL